MKSATRHQIKKIAAAKTCVISEYPLGDKSADCAVVQIRGRYPENGAVLNEECAEMAFVISGRGRVVVDGKGTSLQKGAAIIIEPNEKFYWEGKLTLVMSCTPAWRKEQYKII